MEDGGAIRRVDVPKDREFNPTIPPGESLLLEFSYIPVPGLCIRPSCVLNVAGQKLCHQLELHNDVELQFSGNAVVTAVVVSVPLTTSHNHGLFPPEIENQLPSAHYALFIEDKAMAMVLDVVACYPFYYSQWNVQCLKRNLEAKGSSHSRSRFAKCQVS
ncbi:MAG: hypothetical protein LBL79_14320 [Prevotella sp.]|nr:hypothetical protein [Prevotella sp.]